MAGGVSDKKSDDIVRLVRDQMQDSWEWDRTNREDAQSDLRFLAGDQWPTNVRDQRELAKRPTLTINQLPKFVRQVTNDIRQADLSIKTRPADGETDPVLADIYNGLIRQIQEQSRASNVYANGAEHSVSCGIGHWRVMIKFVEDSVFDQEILIKRIPNPLSVYWDPASIEPDRSDAMWCAVTEFMPLETFKAKYPEAKQQDIDVPVDAEGVGGLYWRSGEDVRIAEYWRKVPTKRRLAAFEIAAEPGGRPEIQTIDITDVSKQALSFMPPIKKERMADGFKVESYIVSGAEVLESTLDYPGLLIPIVAVVGSEVPLENMTYRHGLIRFARDPQQLYNYWRSAAAEMIALAPKSPYVMTRNQMGKDKLQWDEANTAPKPYLLYSHDKDNPGPPKRERAADPPAAMWQEGQLASDDLKNTTALFDASVGARSNETSGRAILARQREGDIATFHFGDNLEFSLMQTGKILVDLIPKVYDGERIVRILGDDDVEKRIQINHQAFEEDGEPVLINDLSAGRFDVKVGIGPSFTTKRLEAAESMVDFVQAFPQSFEIIGDLIAKSMDWPGSEEIAERLKKIVPPEIRETDDDEEPEPPDPMAEITNQLLIAGEQAKVEETQADTAKTIAEVEQTEAETDKTRVETRQLELEAQARVMQKMLEGFFPR